MKSESGHMTALAIIISLLMISVLIYNVKLLSSERDFLYEREAAFRAEMHLQMAREELLDIIHTDGLHEGDSGVIRDNAGDITYKNVQWTDEMMVIQLDVTLKVAGRATGFLYYNYVKNEVVKWVMV